MHGLRCVPGHERPGQRRRGAFGRSPATGPLLTLTDVDDQNGVEPRGGAATYTLTAGVSAGSPVAEGSARLFTIYDPLPAGETLSATPTGDGWNCDESGGSEVRCTTSSQATIAVGATLPSITVPVSVAALGALPAVERRAGDLLRRPVGSHHHRRHDRAAGPSVTAQRTDRPHRPDQLRAPLPPAVSASQPLVKGSSAATFAGSVNPDGLADHRPLRVRTRPPIHRRGPGGLRPDHTDGHGGRGLHQPLGVAVR